MENAEIIVIKTLLGTLIGKTLMKIPLDTRFTISDPVELQNLMIPAQSRLGGTPGITQVTHMVPLLTPLINVVITEPYYFYYPFKTSIVVKQYLDTLEKSQQPKKLDS